MREGVGMAEEVTVSDAMAVERTLGGDRDAYRVLVERHGRWVYRIAANYAIDRIRQRNADEARRETRSKPTEDSLDVDPLSQVRDMSPSPERLAGSAQLAERMKAALAELSPAERTAIVMRHWD